MILDNLVAPTDEDCGIKTLQPPFVVKNIFTAHRYIWKDKYYYLGESHKFHEVVYILNGDVTISEDDSIYYLTKGDLIVHAPYEFHKIATDARAEVLIFSFDSNELFPDAVYDGFFVLSLEEEQNFCRLFDKIYNFYHYEKDVKDFKALSKEIASALPAFFYNLASTHKTYHSGIRSRSEEEYKSIVEIMKRNLYENLSLEEIAEQNHTSLSYVKHLFHRYAGVGAKSYYSTLRLNESIKLLEKGIPVSEVAEMLNFSSPEYFSHFFKKHMGLPPAKWKNQNDKEG